MPEKSNKVKSVKPKAGSIDISSDILEINKRFKFLVNAYLKNLCHINHGKLAQDLGISITKLSNILNPEKKQSVSEEILSNLLRLHPEINIEWILTGACEMLKIDSTFQIELDQQ